MRGVGDTTPVAGRLEFVDSLRGFALFGVFWANLLIFSGIEYLTDKQRGSLFHGRLDAFAYFFERFFIENKFMGLFSLLFGISFWLFLSRVRGRAASATALFYRRIFWLFAIGAVHGWLLWCFDILRFYALWAVLLPLFVRTAPRRLLGIALATSVLIPALVAAVNAGLIHPVAATTDYGAMALAAFSRGSYGEVLKANWRYDWYLTLSIGQLGLTLAYASAMALAFLAVRGRRVVRLLAPMGQMALTWYLLQTLFGIWMFYGFPHGPALMGKAGPAELAAVAVLGYAVQVALARAWMTRFRFGPAEWCWRSLTYGKAQPFRLAAPVRVESVNG